MELIDAFPGTVELVSSCVCVCHWPGLSHCVSCDRIQPGNRSNQYIMTGMSSRMKEGDRVK